MSDANDMEFTPEDLLSQAQGNATAIALATIAYLKERGLAIDEYFEFVGQQFAPSWEELRGQPVADVARTAALNMVSVGGTLRSLQGNDTRAEVLIAEWPTDDDLSELRLTLSDSDPLWNIFLPIMEYLGIHYAWQRQDDGVMMTFERESTE